MQPRPGRTVSFKLFILLLDLPRARSLAKFYMYGCELPFIEMTSGNNSTFLKLWPRRFPEPQPRRRMVASNMFGARADDVEARDQCHPGNIFRSGDSRDFKICAIYPTFARNFGWCALFGGIALNRNVHALPPVRQTFLSTVGSGGSFVRCCVDQKFILWRIASTVVETPVAAGIKLADTLTMGRTSVA